MIECCQNYANIGEISFYVLKAHSIQFCLHNIPWPVMLIKQLMR